MRRKIWSQWVSVILVVALFLQPLVIEAVYADEAGELKEPKRFVVGDDLTAEEIKNEVMPPHKYLEQMLKIRGENKEQIELRAWAEWQQFVNQSYNVLDEGATDLIGFYNTINNIVETATNIADKFETAAKYAHMASAFLKKTARKRNYSTTAAKCFCRFNRWTWKIKQFTESPLFQFLDFCGAPANMDGTSYSFSIFKGFTTDTDPQKGMRAYMNWVKKAPKEDGPNLNNVQGAARTVGIALSVISAGIAVYEVATDEDIQNGRPGSYNAVKKYAALALGVAGLVAMFCVPVVGQVLFIISLIWGLLTAIGDYIGDCNKRWKNAYKNSYWFLYENDPEFKEYYDNRNDPKVLPKDEKSSNLLLIQEKYADLMKDIENDNSDDEFVERNKNIYTALEKQGVLSSYYYRKPYQLDSFKMDILLDLWKAKANYMAWKPTEEEANEDKPWWKKGLDLINPKTYIDWGLDKINSIEYNIIDKYANIDKVVFNPDYVLLQKFVMWVTSNKLMDKPEKIDFVRAFGIRLEQSPFNFIPLVAIDLKDWKDDLMEQAFAGDAFIVGQKEIAALHNQLENLADGMKDVVKDQDDYLKTVKNTYLERSKEDREALNEFYERYKSKGKDGKLEGTTHWKAQVLAKRLHREKEFLEWNEGHKKTIGEFFEEYKDRIERLLLLSPLSISQKGADLVLLHIKMKSYLDMGAIMNAYLKDKEEALADFDNDFKNKDIYNYLKDGSFLDIKGGGILDWLAEIYSAYDETTKSVSQIKKDIEKYNKQANLSASGERGWIFKYEIEGPIELIPDINDELSAWKNTIDNWHDIASDVGLEEDNIFLASDSEFRDQVLENYDEINDLSPLEALDVDNEGIASITLPLDDAVFEAAAEQ